MVNYNNGKIYKIVCNETGEIYYGCTTQKLSKRKECHVSSVKNKVYSSYIIIDRGNWVMSLIEKYPCSSKEELQARENEYILNNPCVNKNRTYNTPEERELQKEKNRERKREYHKENKEIIAKKDKERYEKNKEAKAEKMKEYHEKNKEAINEKNKEYYEKNKEKLNEKIECPCGGKYTFTHKSVHFKTKKHQDYLTNEN